MKMQKHTIKALAIAVGVTASSGVAMADTFTAQASVNGAITLAQINPLDFGTLVATNASSAGTAITQGTGTVAATVGSAAYIELAIDNTVTENAAGDTYGATLVSLVDGTRGEIQVQGAAPFTNITVSSAQQFSASGSVTLDHTVGGTSVPQFIMADLLFDTSNGLVAPDGAADTQGQTDSNGDMDIYVGATLYTDESGTTNPETYQDGAYEGDYEVSVSY